MATTQQPCWQPPDGAILSGGRGRRMGHDKAALTHQGRTLLQIAVEIMRPLVCRVFIVGGSQRCPETHALKDLVPDSGPLGGIYTALCASAAGRLLVLPVDTPLIRSSTLHGLLEASQNTDITMVCTPDGRRHPLCAVYGRRCLVPIRESLQARAYRVDYLLQCKGLTVRLLSSEELGSSPEEFANINTPEEMEWLRKRLSAPNSIG